MSEKNEQDVDLNNEEEVVEEEVESTEETEEETTEEAKEEPKVEKPKESLEDRKARLTRQLGQTNKKLGIDTTKKPVEKIISGDLSTKDIYALMEAKVPEADIEKVQDIATLKDITISEALKLPLTKQILDDESEQRLTASAANVGGSKRGSGKIPDDVLLANAEKGEIPESDADLTRLIKLQRGIK